jgi:magnesium transporter
MEQRPNLDDIFRSRDFTALRENLTRLAPRDLAELIGDAPAHEQAVFFRILPRKLAAATFEYLPTEKQSHLLSSMAQSDTAAILYEMSPDDRTMLLEELPAEVTKELLTMLPADERAIALTLLGYPENSVGRLMTPDYVAVRPEWTIHYVLDYIREHGADSETLSNIYVVDEHGVLIDDLRIRGSCWRRSTNRSTT